MERGGSLVTDYDFYINSYLGTAIPEKSFPAMAARALDALNGLRRQYLVLPADEVSEQMALCAMAETLYSHSGRKSGISSATVGGVSVRYESGGKGLRRELLEKAGIYLDIYRGAKPWNVP